MARSRISEFRAKTLLNEIIGGKYSGIQVNDKRPLNKSILDNSKLYIIKVDQGIKGRFKKGLIKTNLTPDIIEEALNELRSKGYSQFIVEEIFSHDSGDEKYLSVERTRGGYKLLYSEKGGINIEQNQDSIKEILIPYSTSIPIVPILPPTLLELILKTFDKYYFSFLEINPFIILQLPAGEQNSELIILDSAVEVDSTALFFVENAWTEEDLTNAQSKKRTTEEENIQQLAAKSQAAFSLEVLNPEGAIFMMLSGGGASIVLADETANLGYGNKLANYGEYSGNPSAEETYIYAKNIISLMLKSRAPKKVLIIAGGVANFTDVRITFNGLLKALDEHKEKLREEKIKVFVRRGGPFQEEGLKSMKVFLENENLLGVVAGPEMILTDVITKALEHLT